MFTVLASHGRGRGAVTLASADPLAPPRIEHRLLADDADRLTLPDSAVGNTSGQDHVWVIENGVLARRAVTLGRRDPRAGRVEVLQGVTPASQVLAARFDNLREGAKASVAAKGSGSAAAVASAAVPASAPLVK
jgi:hypothetical protein